MHYTLARDTKLRKVHACITSHVCSLDTHTEEENIRTAYPRGGAWYLYPLVLSTSGDWGPSATVAFKRLAGLISEKHDQPYSSTLNFIRCKIAFSLIDSAVACLRGPRSAFHAPAMQGLQPESPPPGPHPC